MSSTLRYYAAACQTDLPNPRTRDEIKDRVEHMIAMIDRAVLGYAPFFPVRLVVFPEFGHAAPIYPTAAELFDRLALPIPNEHTERYTRNLESAFVTMWERNQRGAAPADFSVASG